MFSRHSIAIARNPAVQLAAFLLLLTQSPLCFAAIYKCTAKDGSTTFTNAPCASDTQSVVAVPSPSSSSAHNVSIVPAPSAPNLPDSPSLRCATIQYHLWLRAQTSPPTTDAKNQKLKEIDQHCGATLHLAGFPAPAPTPAQSAPSVPLQTSPASSIHTANTVLAEHPPTPAQHLAVADANPVPAASTAVTSASATQEHTPSLASCMFPKLTAWVAAQPQHPNVALTMAKKNEILDECSKDLQLHEFEMCNADTITAPPQPGVSRFDAFSKSGTCQTRIESTGAFITWKHGLGAIYEQGRPTDGQIRNGTLFHF